MTRLGMFDIHAFKPLGSVRNQGLGFQLHNEAGFVSTRKIRLAIAVVCIFLSACTNRQELPNVTQAQPEPSGTKVPPPKRMVEATDIWKKKNGCDKKVLPFLEIEKQFLNPPSPQRGKEFEHHFVYVACASEAQTPSKGTISRKITHKNKLVFESKNDSFEIKSGKWEHVAKIKTPPEIDPGKYKFLFSISIQNTTKYPTPKEYPFKIRK